MTSTTINGPGTLTNAAGQTQVLTSSIVNADLTNQGLLIARGVVALNGAVTTVAGSTLRSEGNGSQGTAQLQVAAAFTNNGTIELTSLGNGFPSQISVGGLLTNAPSAVIDAQVGVGGARTILAQLANQGTVTINAPLTLSQAGVTHTNGGTIDVAGADFTLTQSGTGAIFNNSGTVTLGAGRTFTVTGGVLNQSAGTIGGTGTLSLSSTIVNLTTNFTNATTGLVVVSSAVNGPGTLTNAAGKTLVLTSSTIGADVTNQGLLIARGVVNLNGALTTVAGSTLRSEGNGSQGTGQLAIGASFTNLGAIELTSLGNGFPSQISVTGTLTNASGGTIDAQAGVGGARTIVAALNNQGLVSVNAPLNLNSADAVHTNSGTINITGFDFNVIQSGTTPSFTNTGTITVGAGMIFGVNGGALNLNAGTVGGTGSLAFFNATVTLGVAFTNTALPMTVSAVTINGPGAFTNAGGLTVIGSTINAALNNQALLLARGTVNLNGALTTTSASIIRAEGNGSQGTAALNVATSFTNTGTIDLTSLGNGFPSQLTMPAGQTLTNAAGATIAATPGVGGARTLTAPNLVNHGAINASTTLAVTANITSDGSMTSSSGALQLGNFGTLAGTVNATGGLFQIAAGDFSLSANLLVIGNMLISGNGVMDHFNGHKLTVAGDLALSGTSRADMTGATDSLVVGGDLNWNSTSTAITLSAGTIVVGGNFTQGGAANSYKASGTHRTAFNGSGTQTITFTNPGPSAAASHFQNLELVAGSVTSPAGPVFANGQLIAPTGGTRHVVGSGTTLSVAGLDVNGMVVDNAVLSSSGGTIARFDNVTFQGNAPTLTPLVIGHPGAPTAFTFNNLSWAVTPSGGGQYLTADDQNTGDGNVLTIDLASSTPVDGSSATGTTNGAVVNWSAAVLRTWTGATSADWSNQANWSGNSVPTISDNVVIPAGTPNQPVLTAAVDVKNLTVASGATVVTGSFTIDAYGNLDAAGAITGSLPVRMRGLGVTARGTADLIVFGTTTLNGNLDGSFTVTGTGAVLALGGHTVTTAGNISLINAGVVDMTNPADSVNATDAFFFGGDETSHLTAGVIRLTGSFSQTGSGSTSSFASTGTRVRFANTSPVSITFTHAGPSHFHDLVFEGSAPVTIASDVPASGQLVSPAGSQTIQGTGNTLSATGLDVDGLVFDQVLLSSTDGTIARFDNVTFQNYAATATPLTIAHPGAASPFTFNTVAWSVTPSGAGRYLSVDDDNTGNGNAFTINLTATTTPTSGPASTAMTNGAVVNWPAVAAVTWNATGDYSTTANPNGPWRSGYSTSQGAALVTYPNNNGVTSGGMNNWFDAANFAVGTPVFAKNLGTGAVNSVPPGMITLHPGCNAAELSQLRWTAATPGTYLFSVQFFAGDAGNTDAVVALNAGTTRFTAASTTSNPGYSRFETMGAGDFMMFAVGTGGDGCFSDNTPLTVTVLSTASVSSTANSATTQGGTPSTPVSAPPSVIVRDASNNPIAGAFVEFVVTAGGGTVTGATAMTDGAGVATVGSWTLGSSVGANTLEARLDGLTPVTFTANSTVPIRGWLGTANDDFNNPANWSGGVTPQPSDDVHIPTGTPFPARLTANGFVVRDLVVDPGATLEVTNFVIDVTRNASGTFFSANTNGAVQLTGGGSSTVSGSFPALGIANTTTAAGNVTVSGSIGVSAGSFDVNGHTVQAQDFSTSATGVLVMTHLADHLLVTRDLTMSGGSTAAVLTDGEIHIGRNFSQTAATSANSFTAAGNHITVFDGAGAQTISFATPANSEFARVDLGNHGSGLNFLTDATATGTVSVLGTTPVTGNGGVTVTLADLVDAGPLWQVPNTKLTGTVLPATMTTHLIVVSTVTLPAGFALTGDMLANDNSVVTAGGNATITGNLQINASSAPSSRFDPNGHTVHITSTLVTTGRGALTMTHPTDSVIVDGGTSFGGDAALLSDGVLIVQNGFTQAFGSFSAAAFRATGNHKTVLSGATAQQVTFFNATPGNSAFNDLEIVTPAVQFNQNATVTGRVVLRGSVSGVTGASGGVTVTLGELHDTTGGRWTVPNTKFTGATPVIPASLTTSATFNGGSTVLPAGFALTGSMTVGGGVSLAGRATVSSGVFFSSTGVLTLAGHTLEVSGGYDQEANGSQLIMTNSADSLIVLTGSATFGGGDETNKLSAGVLHLFGNFSQTGPTTTSFAASGTHKTVLTGATPQNFSFANPGPSAFQDFEIAGATAVMHGMVIANGKTTVAGGMTGSGTNAGFTGVDTIFVPTGAAISVNRLVVGAGLSVATLTNVQPDTIQFRANTPLLPANAIYRVLWVDEANPADSVVQVPSMTVQSLFITQGRFVSNDFLTINDSLRTQGAGVLAMQNINANVTVGSNATFAGGSTAGELTDGSITLGLNGRFTEAGSSTTAFAPSGGMRVLFSGGTSAANFQHPGPSYFRGVQTLDNAGTITFETDVHVTGNLQMAAAGISAAGHDVVLHGADFSSPGGNFAADHLVVRAIPGQSLSGLANAVVVFDSGTVTPAGFGSAAGYDVHVTGSAVVDATSPSGTLAVGGFLQVDGAAVFNMGYDATVNVQGGASFSSSVPNVGLTAGTLTIGGNFTQAGHAQSFVALGAHHTTFNGTGSAQTISFASPFTSFFRELEFDKPAGAAQLVTVLDSVRATDSIIVRNGTELVTASSRGVVQSLNHFRYIGGTDNPLIHPAVMELAGTTEFDSVGAGNPRFFPDTTAFLTGGIFLPTSSVIGYKSVRISPSSHITPVTFVGQGVNDTLSGDLVIDNVGRFIVATNLVVHGKLKTQATGVLQMTSASVALSVRDSAIFDGDDETGLLTDGSLIVGGNFVQSSINNVHSFFASGSHQTVLGGPGTVSFQSPLGSRFANLAVSGTSQSDTRTMLTNVPADGAVINQATLTSGVGQFLMVSGPVVIGAQGTLSTWALDAGGDQILKLGTYAVNSTFLNFNNPGMSVPNLPYNNLNIGGTRLVLWGGPSSIPGSLSVQDTLDMFGQSLTVGNNFNTAFIGLIVMQGGEVLTVVNDASFDGENETGFLTSGTLNVGGGFFQGSGQSTRSFVAAPGFTVNLDGTFAQTIHFDSPGASLSRFGDLKISNGSGAVTLTSAAVADGRLIDQGTSTVEQISGSAATPLTVGGIGVRHFAFNGMPVSVGTVGPFALDTVTWSGYFGGTILTLSGAAADVRQLRANSFPTSGFSGTYVASTLSGGAGNPFTVNVTDAFPLSPGTPVSAGSGTQIDWNRSRLFAGEATVCASDPSSVVYCWGTNSGSFFEWGSSSPSGGSTSPSVNSTLPSLDFYPVGHSQHGCGLTASRSATCWGRNTRGEIGSGSATNPSGPQTVAGGLQWANISVGRLTTCGVTITGTGYCWGANQRGEIGNSTVATGGTSTLSPVTVDGGLTWKTIATGFIHACGLTTAGDVYCWGDNTSGQLGQGTVDASTHITPTLVSGGNTFIQITSGAKHVCGVTTSHQILCWGENQQGQLGDGSTTVRSVPTPVASGLSFGFVAASSGFGDGSSVTVPTGVQAGAAATCALTDSGAPYCWGWNGNGQLGDGSTTDAHSPVAVSGGLQLTTMTLGASATCGMRGNAVWCWGSNFVGQLGVGSNTNSSVPVQVLGPFNIP